MGWLLTWAVLLASAFSSYAQGSGVGVFLGDNVNLRSSPDLKGKVVGQGRLYEKVVFDKTTPGHFTVRDGQLVAGAGWRWYHVTLQNGTQGWAFGKFFGEELAALKHPETDQTRFRLAELDEFMLMEAVSTWYDPEEDGNGPYYEETRAITYVVDEEGLIYPILQTDGSPLYIETGSGYGGDFFGGIWTVSHPTARLLLRYNGHGQEGQWITFYFLSFDGTAFRVVDDCSTGQFFQIGGR